jgi:soluble lytic murein transglycosylase-like protein
MAVEFNLSPLIVGAIYHEVSILDRSNWTTWRFVRTPEYFTYLLCSIIKIESRGREEAVGDNGKAFGLTQMWMTTAKMHDKSVTKSDLLNPIRHIPLAVKHFAYLLEESGGNIGVATINLRTGT